MNKKSIVCDIDNENHSILSDKQESSEKIKEPLHLWPDNDFGCSTSPKKKMKPNLLND